MAETSHVPSTNPAIFFVIFGLDPKIQQNGDEKRSSDQVRG